MHSSNTIVTTVGEYISDIETNIDNYLRFKQLFPTDFIQFMLLLKKFPIKTPLAKAFEDQEMVIFLTTPGGLEILFCDANIVYLLLHNGNLTKYFATEELFQQQEIACRRVEHYSILTRLLSLAEDRGIKLLIQLNMFKDATLAENLKASYHISVIKLRRIVTRLLAYPETFEWVLKYVDARNYNVTFLSQLINNPTAIMQEVEHRLKSSETFDGIISLLEDPTLPVLLQPSTLKEICDKVDYAKKFIKVMDFRNRWAMNHQVFAKLPLQLQTVYWQGERALEQYFSNNSQTNTVNKKQKREQQKAQQKLLKKERKKALQVKTPVVKNKTHMVQQETGSATALLKGYIPVTRTSLEMLKNDIRNPQYNTTIGCLIKMLLGSDVASAEELQTRQDLALFLSLFDPNVSLREALDIKQAGVDYDNYSVILFLLSTPFTLKLIAEYPGFLNAISQDAMNLMFSDPNLDDGKCHLSFSLRMAEANMPKDTLSDKQTARDNRLQKEVTQPTPTTTPTDAEKAAEAIRKQLEKEETAAQLAEQESEKLKKQLALQQQIAAQERAAKQKAENQRQKEEALLKIKEAAEAAEAANRLKQQQAETARIKKELADIKAAEERSKAETERQAKAKAKKKQRKAALKQKKKIKAAEAEAARIAAENQALQASIAKIVAEAAERKAAQVAKDNALRAKNEQLCADLIAAEKIQAVNVDDPITHCESVKNIFVELKCIPTKFDLIGSEAIHAVLQHHFGTGIHPSDVDLITDAQVHDELVESGFTVHDKNPKQRIYTKTIHGRHVEIKIVTKESRNEHVSHTDLTISAIRIDEAGYIYDPTGRAMSDLLRKRLAAMPTYMPLEKVLHKNPACMLRVLRYQADGLEVDEQLTSAIRNWQLDSKPHEVFSRSTIRQAQFLVGYRAKLDETKERLMHLMKKHLRYIKNNQVYADLLHDYGLLAKLNPDITAERLSVSTLLFVIQQNLNDSSILYSNEVFMEKDYQIHDKNGPYILDDKNQPYSVDMLGNLLVKQNDYVFTILNCIRVPLVKAWHVSYLRELAVFQHENKIMLTAEDSLTHETQTFALDCFGRPCGQYAHAIRVPKNMPHEQVVNAFAPLVSALQQHGIFVAPALHSQQPAAERTPTPHGMVS